MIYFLFQERFFANDGAPDQGRELITEYRQTTQQFRKFLREFSVGGFQMIYRYVISLNDTFSFQSFHSCYILFLTFWTVKGGYLDNLTVFEVLCGNKLLIFSSEKLKRNYNVGNFHLEVSLNHLKMFDEDIEQKLRKYPQKFLPAVSFFLHLFSGHCVWCGNWCFINDNWLLVLLVLHGEWMHFTS